MSDLQTYLESKNDPNLVVIGIGIPGETPNTIESFRQSYGITVPIWIDNNNNYRELIEPGGRQFPIDIVIDQEGVVRYLENAYYPGAMAAEADKLL